MGCLVPLVYRGFIHKENPVSMIDSKVAAEAAFQACFQTKEGQFDLHAGKHSKFPHTTARETPVTPVTPSSQLPRREIVAAFAQTREEAQENSAFFPGERAEVFMPGLLADQALAPPHTALETAGSGGWIKTAELISKERRISESDVRSS